MKVRKGGDGLQFGSKGDGIRRPRDVEGLLSHSVSGQMQNAVPAIPQADSEHSVAAPQGRLKPPPLDHRQQNLRIATPDEVLALAFEFPPQRSVIVDLAIERNDEPAAVRKHRLPARVGKVDDGEPAMPERNSG